MTIESAIVEYADREGVDLIRLVQGEGRVLKGGWLEVLHQG